MLPGGQFSASPCRAVTSEGDGVLEGRVEPVGLPLDVRVVVGSDQCLSLGHQSVPHPNAKQPGIPVTRGVLCQCIEGRCAAVLVVINSVTLSIFTVFVCLLSKFPE